MTTDHPDPSRQDGRAHSLLALLGFFLLCYAVAGFGAVFTASSIPTWYAALAKPGFNPPNSLFAPVWTILYGLMAIAAWLVWRTPPASTRSHGRVSSLVLFGIQLFLNALWTPVFFRLHLLLPALIIIVGLWFFILFATLRFWTVNRIAAALMLPYLAWVGFASALNFEIYRLN